MQGARTGGGGRRGKGNVARARGKGIVDNSVTACRDEGACMRACRRLTLIRAQDFGAAARFLEPLCQQGEGSPALRSAIARIYLQGGHLGAASQHFAAVEADPKADDGTKDMNRAIEAAAYGQWDKAILALKRVLQADPNDALVCVDYVARLLPVNLNNVWVGS